ncbi:hypothetical protein Tco_0880881 [Tanacetum coccineum]
MLPFRRFFKDDKKEHLEGVDMQKQIEEMTEQIDATLGNYVGLARSLRTKWGLNFSRQWPLSTQHKASGIMNDDEVDGSLQRAGNIMVTRNVQWEEKEVTVWKIQLWKNALAEVPGLVGKDVKSWHLRME